MCHGSSSYLMGLQVTAGTSTNEDQYAGCEIRLKINGTRGRSNSPSESQPMDPSKPLKTIAKHNFTSKRPVHWEGMKQIATLRPSVGMKVDHASQASL
jgi:hypothetical protein